MLPEGGKLVLMACPTALAMLPIWFEFGRDLLAQIAQEVLLAGDAHEVGVGVAVAHVGERVFVAELLVAGLEVDVGVVGFGGADVFVEVAVVDVDVDAAELVDEADEAGEGDVDDAVELEPGEHLFDGLGGERGALVVPGQDAADGVGGVDLRGVVDLPARRGDRDEQIARDREHGGLFLFGVEAHEQHRVAVRGGEAFFGVLGAVAFVGAEDQEGLGTAAVDRGDEPVGRVDLVELGEDLGGELVGGAQRPDGRWRRRRAARSARRRSGSASTCRATTAAGARLPPVKVIRAVGACAPPGMARLNRC